MFEAVAYLLNAAEDVVVCAFSPRLYVRPLIPVSSSVETSRKFDFLSPSNFPFTAVSGTSFSLGNFSTEPKTYVGNMSLLKAS